MACNALSLPQGTPRYSEAEAVIVSSDTNIGYQSIADYIPVASFSLGHDVDLLDICSGQAWINTGFGFTYETDKHVAVCVYVSVFEYLVTN